MRPSSGQRYAASARRQRTGIEMARGKVLWFNPITRYTQPSDGRTDVPVDRLAVELAGHQTLKPGQKLRYEVVRGLNGKTRAATLRLID